LLLPHAIAPLQASNRPAARTLGRSGGHVL
jgi:hypothetical protein